MNKPMSGDGTVGKALEILDSVAQFDHGARFSDLQEICDFPKATLYRFLQILTNQGMLHYDEESRSYRVGLRLVRMAHKAWQQSSLAPIAAKILSDLADEAKETIHLAQMEAGQVLFIDKYRTSSRFDTLAQAGRIAPAHCTGVGKAILAHLNPRRFEEAMSQQNFAPLTAATHQSAESLIAELEVIRAEGVAFDREEHEQGIISIAAPIITETGGVLGAVSIATTTTRHSLDSLLAFKPPLITATNEIGQAASAWQFPQA